MKALVILTFLVNGMAFAEPPKVESKKEQENCIDCPKIHEEIAKSDYEIYKDAKKDAKKSLEFLKRANNSKWKTEGYLFKYKIVKGINKTTAQKDYNNGKKIYLQNQRNINQMLMILDQTIL